MSNVNNTIRRSEMKVSTVIEAGSVESFYMSGWSDNELEMQVSGGTVKVNLPENVIKNLHKRLGEKLTDLAEKRLQEAKEAVEEENE
jgi:hypothetical protein|tara:strand:+ start:154 stop:414 length:261 start_codon:yes stop_codon:yes gene_type:complete